MIKLLPNIENRCFQLICYQSKPLTCKWIDTSRTTEKDDRCHNSMTSKMPCEE